MIRSALLCIFALGLAACGGASTADDVPGDDVPGDDAPGDDTYTAVWGPVTVPPGEERTQCVTLDLGNTAPIKVHTLHNTLSTLSHHFIVYRDDAATAESPTPTDCQPFLDTLNPSGTSSPVMITQRHEETLTLPDRVAYTFHEHQFVRLEMHYINAGDAPAEATATAEFIAVPQSEIDHEAEFLFIGSPDIDYTLQPGESATLQAYFPLPASLSGINYFAITGHTHQLGTDMDVSTAPTAGGSRTEVYNPTPFSWSEPETRRHEPPFQIPDGGGFDFACTWTNGGSAATTFGFGESANDEMCFFWAYYYPSRGAKVCIHTEQFGGYDICCPDPDSQAICNLIGGS
jgi:hypothetical protein